MTAAPSATFANDSARSSAAATSGPQPTISTGCGLATSPNAEDDAVALQAARALRQVLSAPARAAEAEHRRATEPPAEDVTNGLRLRLRLLEVHQSYPASSDGAEPRSR